MASAYRSLSQAIFPDKAALSRADEALWQLCRALCFGRPSARDPALEVDSVRAAGLGTVAFPLAQDPRFERDVVAGELVWELRSRFAREAVEALAAAGVAPLLCKGVAVAECVYPQPWMRPMTDIDLLVPAERLQHAQTTLERIGYEHEGERLEQSAMHHAVTMRRESSTVDLHRSVLQPSRDRGLSRLLLSAAVPSALLPGALRPEPAALALAQLAFLSRAELVAPANRFVELHWILSRLDAGEREQLDRYARAVGMRRPIEWVRKVVAGFANGHSDYPAVLPGPGEIVRGEVPSRAVQLARKLALAAGPADALAHIGGAVRERIGSRWFSGRGRGRD